MGAYFVYEHRVFHISHMKIWVHISIPVELFQILKDDTVKVLHSVCQLIWKTQQWPQDWKRSVFISIPKKAMQKNAQTTEQLHSSQMLLNNAQNSPSQASRVREP